MRFLAASIAALAGQLTARLDKLGVETWAQAAERAARFEIDRARRVATASASLSDSQYLTYRYQHIVVDEAQDLRPAHWKMLRAMVGETADDLFITGDAHQRIYDNQVALGAVGINIRGRAARLTLSYRTTREILHSALAIMSGEQVDNLDDGVDSLAGYRSVLHGPPPAFVGYPTWQAELEGLAATIHAWREGMITDGPGNQRDLQGLIAVCVAAHSDVDEVVAYLTGQANLSCAELTKDGPRGDGEIHVGTMHRFKGLEYQRIAIVAASDSIVPRGYISRFADTDPHRYQRERRKDRSLLFVAATRARDGLVISWHGKPSPFLPR